MEELYADKEDSSWRNHHDCYHVHANLCLCRNSDGIASYRSMENYISQIQQNGPNTKIEVFKGLSHGFGLGEGTVAEGWIDRAISFWEDNMNALDKR